MILAPHRSASGRDAIAALITACAAILLFAGYCQMHSWFDAARVPFNVSLKWGLAMGIPSAAAALLLWQSAPRLANWVNGRVASAIMLWAAIAATGVALAAAIHVEVGGTFMDSYPIRLLSRMYNLLPEVSALAAFTVCFILLRHSATRGGKAAAPTRREWLSFPEAPALLLRTRDILYIKSAGNYCEIHSSGKTHLIRLSLSRATARLEPIGFLRIHRTLTVNSRHISEVDRGLRARTPSVRIGNGHCLPIGKAYLSSLRKRLESGPVDEGERTPSRHE
jgi:hypothetical protein